MDRKQILKAALVAGIFIVLAIIGLSTCSKKEIQKVSPPLSSSPTREVPALAQNLLYKTNAANSGSSSDTTSNQNMIPWPQTPQEEPSEKKGKTGPPMF